MEPIITWKRQKILALPNGMALIRKEDRSKMELNEPIKK
jgi:hypothetical protein